MNLALMDGEERERYLSVNPVVSNPQSGWESVPTVEIGIV